ncbi:MAG: hypothetical protein MJ162_00635 [Treponema sp.]|nr:hypothetical protein [Treponema sp.]
MKKILLAFVVAIFCSVSSVYAESDLQIGLGGPAFEMRNASLFSVNIGNHNFLGEKENIGFAEYVSFSPVTVNMFDNCIGFNCSAFAGAAFKFSPFENSDVLLSTGFKYFMYYAKGLQNFPNSTDSDEEKRIIVEDTRFFSSYSISLDVQIKFFADKKISVALGIPVSVGIGSEEYKETVKAKNPNSVYKSLSSNGGIEEYMEVGLPYVMFCVNF